MTDTDHVPSAEIPLGRGLVAIVDATDLPLLAGYNWRAQRSRNTSYAVAWHGPGERRTLVLMHRLILVTSAPMIDHADGNGLNNRRANLRPATSAQNTRNRRLQKHTSSFKGVTVHGGNWQACIRHDGETIHLGTFEREEDAAKQYDRAARLLHGEFAKTNAMLGLLAA